MISAIYNFALTTGANRVIKGARIEHVEGDIAYVEPWALVESRL